MVVVDLGLLGPVTSVGCGQRFHRVDCVFVRLNDRVIRGEIRDVASGWAVFDFLPTRFASTGCESEAGKACAFQKIAAGEWIWLLH
jgi:hypothetical protein